jgi:hypothetical protein
MCFPRLTRRAAYRERLQQEQAIKIIGEKELVVRLGAKRENKGCVKVFSF